MKVHELQRGNYIIWKGEPVEFTDQPRISPGMVGRVVMSSPNPLARQLRQRGIEIPNASWALVEFENGSRMTVDNTDVWNKLEIQ